MLTNEVTSIREKRQVLTAFLPSVLQNPNSFPCRISQVWCCLLFCEPAAFCTPNPPPPPRAASHCCWIIVPSVLETGWCKISTELFFILLCSSSVSSEDVFACRPPLLGGYSRITLESFFPEVFCAKPKIKQLVSPSNWCLLSVGSHTSVFPSAPRSSMRNY